MSSDPRWRVAAIPDHLLTLATMSERFGDAVRSARIRCASNAYVDPSPVDALFQRSTDLAESVRRVGQRLDAADLADRLTRYSSVLRSSMRSRALNHRSGQTKLLGEGNSRQFFRIVTAGNGRVVEVIGDLRHARHVAVIVPGMTNSIRDYDPNTRIKGTELAKAMRAYDPSTAVVVWLGYRTPNQTAAGLAEGAASGRAQDGARQLVDDLEVLRRMAPESHLTVIGHSYGSVVAGETLLSYPLAKRVDALGIEDVAVVGSPGMNTNSRRALGHPDIDVWASKVTTIDPGSISVSRNKHRGFEIPLPVPMPYRIGPFGNGPVAVDLSPPHPSDLIPFLPVHGEDPSAKGFGAKRFSSAGATGHSEYFKKGTLALENLARIATNRPVGSTQAPGTDQRDPGKAAEKKDRPPTVR